MGSCGQRAATTKRRPAEGRAGSSQGVTASSAADGLSSGSGGVGGLASQRLPLLLLLQGDELVKLGIAAGLTSWLSDGEAPKSRG